MGSKEPAVAPDAEGPWDFVCDSCFKELGEFPTLRDGSIALIQHNAVCPEGPRAELRKLRQENAELWEMIEMLQSQTTNE